MKKRKAKKEQEMVIKEMRFKQLQKKKELQKEVNEFKREMHIKKNIKHEEQKRVDQ